jgi:hypothetical protein
VPVIVRLTTSCCFDCTALFIISIRTDTTPHYRTHPYLVQSEFHAEHVRTALAKNDPFTPSASEKDAFTPPGGSKKDAFTPFVVVVPNGIAQMPPPPSATLRNRRHVFIFGSAPSRGLGLVLHRWAYIKTHIPEAILEVYYGFTDSAVRELKSGMDEETWERWWAQM